MGVNRVSFILCNVSSVFLVVHFIFQEYLMMVLDFGVSVCLMLNIFLHFQGSIIHDPTSCSLPHN